MALEVGKKADLLVVNTQRAHLVPAGRFLSAWIHNGQGSDIESVMIDGQFVIRAGKVLTMDEAAAKARVARLAFNDVPFAFQLGANAIAEVALELDAVIGGGAAAPACALQLPA